MGTLRSRRADHFVLESVEGVSGARVARRMARRRRARRDSMTPLAAIKKLADGRLCSPGPMQYAVAAALTGDRSHQVAFRAALRRTRAHHHRTLERDSRHALCRAAGGVLRAAVGHAAARDAPTSTSCWRCCVRPASCACNGSGFGVPAEDGFFRIVFLANPRELEQIYADIGAFTGEYLARG